MYMCLNETVGNSMCANVCMEVCKCVCVFLRECTYMCFNGTYMCHVLSLY